MTLPGSRSVESVEGDPHRGRRSQRKHDDERVSLELHVIDPHGLVGAERSHLRDEAPVLATHADDMWRGGSTDDERDLVDPGRIAVAAAYAAPLAAAQFEAFAHWAVGAAVSGAGGFASGYVASDGNLEYARRSGLSAMAFYGIGQLYMGKTLELKDMAIKAVAHGLVGGSSAAANGGAFESGFASSFISEAVSLGDGYDSGARALGLDASSAAYAAASSALVSGATSELTGGTFEQGAISGALGALYNRYFHRILERDGSQILELVHQQDGNPDEPCTLKYETVLKAVVIGEDGIEYDPVAGFVLEMPIAFASAAAEGAGGLIHFTSSANAVKIGESGLLLGRSSGVFALRESAAGRGWFRHAALTGIAGKSTQTFVSVPEAAAGAFQQVLPVGPYTALKWMGGVRFTAPGVIDMSTGAFTQTGSILVPYAWTYGIDAAIYGAGAQVSRLRR